MRERERKSQVWVWVIGFWVGWLGSDSGVSHEFRVRSSRLRENGTQPGLCCFLLCFANCYAWSLSTAFALFWAPRVCYNIFFSVFGCLAVTLRYGSQRMNDCHVGYMVVLVGEFYLCWCGRLSLGLFCSVQYIASSFFNINILSFICWVWLITLIFF